MMRTRYLLPLLTLLAACGQGDPGPTGKVGAEGPTGPRCTASEQAGRWLVQCPDGTRADLDLASCLLDEDESGTQRIACPDGTEATVLPDASSMAGSIVGKVRLEADPTWAGVLIELVGTELTARSLADGSYRLDGVAPGNYELRFSFSPYQPQVVPGISSFGGIFEVGTVVLRNTRNLPRDYYEFSPEAALVLVTQATSIEIHDLSAAEVHRLLMPPGVFFDFGSIEDDGAVVLRAFHPTGTQWFGTWRAEEGVLWYEDVMDAYYARTATLIARALPAGARALWVVRGGIETQLEIEDILEVNQLGEDGRWMIVAEEGTFVVDAMGTESTTTVLSSAACSLADLDQTGLLGVVICDGVPGVYDFSRTSWVVQEEEDGVPFRTVYTLYGAAVWGFDTLGSDRKFYDAFSGKTFDLLDDEILRTSGPGAKWLWSTADDGLRLVRRDGELRHDFEELNPVFSPDEEKFFSHDGGDHHLVDLRTGELKTIPDLQVCGWVNGDGIVCTSLPSGSLVIVNLAGEVRDLGFVDSYEFESGWLIYEKNGRTNLTAPGADDFELGPVWEVSLSEDGGIVAWVNAAGALYAMNLETGVKARLATAAEEPLALDSGVIFIGYTFPAGETPFFAPYPW